jgi:hypothetical protein
LLTGYTIALIAGSPAMADSAKSFTLQKGQATRITPEGKVEILTKMRGDSGHIAEMEKRSMPVTKGLAIWVGKDGKLRYLTDPVEDAGHGRH